MKRFVWHPSELSFEKSLLVFANHQDKVASVGWREIIWIHFYLLSPSSELPVILVPSLPPPFSLLSLPPSLPHKLWDWSQQSVLTKDLHVIMIHSKVWELRGKTGTCQLFSWCVTGVGKCVYVHTCVIQNYELMVKLNDIVVLIL